MEMTATTGIGRASSAATTAIHALSTANATMLAKLLRLGQLWSWVCLSMFRGQTDRTAGGKLFE